jgi:multidrug efflux pump subunit AcrA (membrane-fusion protein)
MRRPIFPSLALAFALGAAAPAQAADANNTGAVGQIAPAGGIIDLGGSGAAIITSINVEIGDAVKAGQLLATVQDDSLQANHTEAAKQLDRATGGRAGSLGQAGEPTARAGHARI